MRREAVHEQTSIAEPERVWAVLVRRFTEAGPHSGLGLGATRLDTGAPVRLAHPAGRGMRHCRAAFLRVLPGQELSWLARTVAPGLFDTEYRVVLEPLPEGGTRVLLRVRWSGILLPVLWWRWARPQRRALGAWLRALREGADSPVDGGPDTAS